MATPTRFGISKHDVEIWIRDKTFFRYPEIRFAGVTRYDLRSQYSFRSGLAYGPWSRVSRDESSKGLGRNQESYSGAFRLRSGGTNQLRIASCPRGDATCVAVVNSATRPLTLLEKKAPGNTPPKERNPRVWGNLRDLPIDGGQPSACGERSSTGDDLSDCSGIQVVFLVLPLAVLLPEQGDHEAKGSSRRQERRLRHPCAV